MKLVPNRATRLAAKAAFKAQKHSPTLLWGAGMFGFGLTIVAASAATLKVGGILDHAEKDLIDADAKLVGKDQKHAKAMIYFDTGMELGRLYAPTIVLGSATVLCFTQSHLILNRRNAALTVAYAGLDQAFREYRERVRQNVGEETERNLFYSSEMVDLVEDTSKGPKKITSVRHGNGSLSQYAVLYDNTSPGWQASPEFRFLWLKGKQNWMNKQLDKRGHVFLNDVYDELEMDRTPAGSQVGWLLNGDGDGFIDFGFEDPNRADTFLEFVLGREGAIWLDFNVDGVIWDKI